MQTAKAINFTPPLSFVIEEYDPAQWSRYESQFAAACVVPTHTGPRPDVLVLKPEIVASWPVKVAKADGVMRSLLKILERYEERLTAEDVAQITEELNRC